MKGKNINCGAWDKIAIEIELVFLWMHKRLKYIINVCKNDDRIMRVKIVYGIDIECHKCMYTTICDIGIN